MESAQFRIGRAAESSAQLSDCDLHRDSVRNSVLLACQRRLLHRHVPRRAARVQVGLSGYALSV